MVAHPNIRLLVVDSVSFHFRHDFPDARDRAKLLRTVTKELIQPAVTHKMAVSVVLLQALVIIGAVTWLIFCFDLRAKI